MGGCPSCQQARRTKEENKRIRLEQSAAKKRLSEAKRVAADARSTASKAAKLKAEREKAAKEKAANAKAAEDKIVARKAKRAEAERQRRARIKADKIKAEEAKAEKLNAGNKLKAAKSGGGGAAVGPSTATGNSQVGKGPARKRKRKDNGNGGRDWVLCPKCQHKHWSTGACPAHARSRTHATSAPSPTGPVRPTQHSKRWSGNTTAGLLVSLKARVALEQEIMARQEKQDMESRMQTADQQHASSDEPMTATEPKGPEHAPLEPGEDHNPLGLLARAANISSSSLAPDEKDSTTVGSGQTSETNRLRQHYIEATQHSRGGTGSATAADAGPLGGGAQPAATSVTGAGVSVVSFRHVQHSGATPTANASADASNLAQLAGTALQGRAVPGVSTGGTAEAARPREDQAGTAELGQQPAPHTADTLADASADDTEAAVQAQAVSDVYNIIKSKVDVTSAGDGYGMTGHVTKASMSRLFDVMRTKFDFDSNAWFMDLGHGMGRPSMHAAALQPPVAGAFGTEFNPQLYKQSMLALVECTQSITCFQKTPRTFFLDANIKDLTSLNPFTHVYAFQIGMPEDVIEHMLNIIAESESVKYAILYPHRAASVKRLQQLGTIVHTQSMHMPGGSSYEVNVIKVRHRDSTTAIDPDINTGIEVLSEPLLYSEYLNQLGIVSALENEEWEMRRSRKQRRNGSNKKAYSSEPCFMDINYGLLRRVAVALGVSTAGGKEEILANIEDYCPETFALGLFVVGSQYTDDHVQLIVNELLSAAPSRRQPEATH